MAATHQISTPLGGRHARPLALAAVAVALGLGWRVSSLGPESLYRDDTWQALATRTTSIGDTLQTGVTAPGYAGFLHLWSMVAGRSSLALQVPAVVAGIVAPVLVYWLARRFRLRPPAAAVAAVFMFTGQTALQMSVRVKPFALDALVTMAVLALGIRATEAADDDRRWYQLVAACGLALLFSASTLPVTTAVLLTVGIAGWGVRRHRVLFSTAAAACAVLATWYVVVVSNVTTDQLRRFWTNNYAPLSGGPAFPRRALDLARQFFEQAGPKELAEVFAVVIAVASAVGVVALARRRDWTAIGLLTGPIAVAAVAAVASITPFGGGRTDLYLYPCLALLVAAAVDSAKGAAVPISGVACAAMLVAASTSWRDSYPHEDLRGAVAAARAESGEGTEIVVFPEFGYAWSFYAPDGTTVRRDELSMTGFTPVDPDPHTLLLSGFQTSGQGEVSQELREQAAARVRRVVSSPAVNDVWIVRSALFDVDDVTEVDDELVDLGFVQVDGFDHDLGVAEHWTRPAASA